jgi:catechol 2,3-dioxygenase-like lactoylglutathione lyase family enzyme
MRSWIRGLALFAAGVALGMVTIKTISAQQDKGIGVHINHVGIFCKNFQESIDYYTKTLGMREAFVFRDKEGKVTTSYIQVDKNTFLELAPATAERPAGLNHIGLQADNIGDTVAELRKRGITVNDARAGNSKAPLTNITDPNGVRLELLEYVPDSLQRKAMDSWGK